MKDELTNEAYEALSKYRQSRAHETLEEIPFLREKGYFGTATNRLYYAAITQLWLCWQNIISRQVPMLE